MKTEKGPPTDSEEINPEKKFEEKDFTHLRDRIITLIRQISGKPNLEVTTELTLRDAMSVAKHHRQDPEKAWFRVQQIDPVTRAFKREYVHIPRQILESAENMAKGKAAHEAGHVVITRMGKFIPDSVLRETGFPQLMTALEERPTDQVVRDRFPGAGMWVDEVRQEQVDKGEYVIQQKKGQLGYLPKSLQLSDLIVFGRCKRNITDVYDAAVRDVYEELIPEIERVEHTLPPNGSSESEVMETAKRRYKITYAKLWPKVKPLVEQDLELEKLRQMLSDAMKEEEKDSEEGKGEEEKNPLEKLLDALDEEFKKELDEASSKKMEEKDEESAKGKVEETPHESPQSEIDKSDAETDEPDEKDDEGKTIVSGVPGEPEEGSSEESEQNDSQEELKKFGKPIAMDKLSEAFLRALKKAFDSLPEEIREELEKRARLIYELIEDEIVEEQVGDLTEVPIGTHDEVRARIIKEVKDKEYKDKKNQERMQIEQEVKDVEAKLAALEANKSFYEETYQSLRELDEKLYRELEEIFTPNVKRTMRLKSAGAKINLPAVYRWESSRQAGARQTDNKIFETVHLPEKKDYAFTILNDLSGSMMKGGKIEEDFKAKVLLTEVLNRLGITYEILGFQERIYEYKKFDEPLTDEVRMRIEGLVKVPFAPNLNNRLRRNADGYCLTEASQRLDKISSREKFLIVISDGLPTLSRNPNSSPGEELMDAVKEILTSKKDQKLIGLGLGQGTEHVKSFYPTAIPNITAEGLVETIGGLLEDMIINPNKYNAVR